MGIPEEIGIPEWEFRLVFAKTKVTFDENKELENRKKHKYSLMSAFHYFEALMLPIKHEPFMTSDSFVENGEVRHMHMGLHEGSVVVFVTTMREEEVVRVISFRRASNSESEEFFQQIAKIKLNKII